MKKAILAVLVSLGLASDVLALGGANIGNEVPSARAAGQGFVGVAAQNDDPLIAYANPAGLTQLKGTQVTLGAAWENLHGNYESVSGNKTKMRSVDVAVPNGAVTRSFQDGRAAVGLAVLSPFGLETHWAGDSPLRYVTTDARLHLVFIAPSVAYQLHPKVSIGAGADYVNAFDASLEKKVSVDAVNTALGAGTLGSPDANSRLKGTGTNWGYHAGILFQPTERHSFGFAYHSKIKLTVNGSAELKGLSGASAFLFGGSDYSTSAYTDIVLPQNLQFGYAFKPTAKWIWEVDAAWYDWSSGRDLNIRYSETDPNRLAVLNVGNPSALSLRNTWNIATGINYKWTDRTQLRGGFWYLPHSMPESTFNPAYLDLSRYGLTFGAGYALTSALQIDLAYNAIFFHNRHVNNNVGTNSSGIPGYNINGAYKNFTNLIAMNFTYKWQ
jgi:long-chain fatty acid transport protein